METIIKPVLEKNERASVIEETNAAVNALLAQLNEYYTIVNTNQAEIQRLQSEIKSFEDSGQVVGRGMFANAASKKYLENKSSLKQLEGEIQAASDVMRFQSPAIWLMYKAAAYRGTDKVNNTVGDFVKHTENDTICNARLMFLDCYLVKHCEKSFKDFDNNLDLEKFSVSDTILNLFKDKDFMSRWKKWENYDEDGFLDKWRTLKFSDFKTNANSREALKQYLLA